MIKTGTDILKAGTLTSAVFAGKNIIEAAVNQYSPSLYIGAGFALATMAGICVVSALDNYTNRNDWLEKISQSSSQGLKTPNERRYKK